jgi:hypothetical protein
MKTLLILALGLVCSLPARADILPDKPEPQVSVHHNPITYPLRATADTFKDVVTFKDKQFSVVALLYIGAYGADMISTQEMFGKFPPTPGHRASVEGGPFFHGTRDAGRIAAAWGGVTIANIVIAHEWKKHVKNRFLRDLWSAGIVYQSAEHIDAAVGNLKLGSSK